MAYYIYLIATWSFIHLNLTYPLCSWQWLARGYTDLALCSGRFGSPIGTTPAISWAFPEIRIFLKQNWCY